MGEYHQKGFTGRFPMTIEKSIASRNVTAINDKGSRIDIESTEKICGTERKSVDSMVEEPLGHR